LTRSVTAKIVEETGAAVVGQPVYICGLNVCSPAGQTQVGGTVTISTTSSMKGPAFKFGDEIASAALASPVVAAMTDVTQGGTTVLGRASSSSRRSRSARRSDEDERDKGDVLP
jgi:hypothetical protein